MQTLRLSVIGDISIKRTQGSNLVLREEPTISNRHLIDYFDPNLRNQLQRITDEILDISFVNFNKYSILKLNWNK